jgi:hypothetical protein
MERSAVKQSLCQTLSQSQTIAAVGDTGNFQYIVPDGYKELVGIYFDPSKDIAVTLTSQKANKNITNNFSTLIGTSLGFLPLKTQSLQNDLLSLQWTVIAAPTLPTTLTFTLMFE